MKKLLYYLKDYKKESVLAPLFKMLEATLELFVPLTVAAIIDTGIANGDRGYVGRMCLVLVALGLTGLAFSITAQFFAAKAAVGFATKLRHALFAHIQRLSYAEIDTQGTSTLITRMTSDMNQVQNGVNMTLRLLLRSPFVVIGAMVMAFTIDVRSALVFAVGIPVLAVVVFGIILSCVPLYRKVQNRLDGVLGLTRENLTGVRVLRSFGKEAEEEAAFREKNQALTDAQKFVGRISALLNPITYVIINTAIIALIWIGAIRVDQGILTQGAVVALYNYMAQILTELIKLANLIVNITKSVACGNRIQAVLEVEPTVKDGTDEVSKSAVFADAGRNTANHAVIQSGSAEQIAAAVQTDESFENHEVWSDSAKQIAASVYTDGSAASQEANGEVRAEGISSCHVAFYGAGLRYPNASEEALSSITLRVHRGQTVGIIGGTGSGKSSLVNLIPRFYDCSSGAVYVDGKDVRSFALDELREKIGVVPQRAVLFAGTIRSNLKWGNPDATEEELMEALEIAQAKEVVLQKEKGLDEPVEQGGKNFSGGQRQRLTIARALVRKPEILILDDSSSALDFATDAALRRTLGAMKDKPTIFIVSQRTSAIAHADIIVALDDGEAVGIGTHEELLASCGVYREIYESQFKKNSGEVQVS